MTTEQEERIVVAWESIAQGLGVFNEISRSAISKQWPESRERSDAIVTRIPTAEDKIRAQTGNTDGPVEEWLERLESEDDEDVLGPREKAFLARQAKNTRRSKGNTKAGGSGTAGA